ncbi:uncharacterized protein LOC112349731 [Selaginella moellendorffii]|uniref:uncharacterized protein LOC112349731 n=1 Tax=Selaginella moellendorffii TaxID=88036 RepID=UPI000D1C9904|nr:uncharacterized protein LOC112349731 [Selaginella moellendorffii]|eukprot:XP_024540450.1 uncharacterized protein LOC112349731 [Selaginella moellendorffii]
MAAGKKLSICALPKGLMDLEVDYRLVQGMSTPIFGEHQSILQEESRSGKTYGSRDNAGGDMGDMLKRNGCSLERVKMIEAVSRKLSRHSRKKLASFQEPQSQCWARLSGRVTPNYSPRVTHRSRQLLEAMRSLEPSKDSFLQFESPVEPVNEEPLKTPTLLHLLLNGHEGQRAETRKKVSIDNGSTRITISREGDDQQAALSRFSGETTSNKVFETQPRFHREEFEPDSPAREKVLHAVTETKTQQQSAREFVIHRLRDGSKDAKEIAQEIARKARESAFRDVSSHLPSPERTPLDIQDASTPTLRRYISCHQSLESANLTTSSPAYQTTPIKLSRKQALVDEDRPGDTLEQRTFSEDYDTRLAPQVEIVEATGNASETLQQTSPVSILELRKRHSGGNATYEQGFFYLN